MIALVVISVLFNVGIFTDTTPDSQIDQPLDPNGENDQKPGSTTPLPTEDPSVQFEKDNNMPSTRYPMQVLNYCIEKLNNSSGYYMDLLFNTTITGNVVGLSASGEQRVTGSVIKSGDKRYEDIKLEAMNEITKQFTPKDNLQVMYNDGQLCHFWETDLGVFDITKARYETWTPDNNPRERRFYYDFLYPGIENSFGYYGPIVFNSKGSTASLKTQKNASTGRKEYVITVKMIDKNYVPEPFIRSFQSFEGGINMSSIEQNTIFTIDKESGWIKSLVKKDIFIGRPKMFSGAEVKCVLTYTSNYSLHNQNIEIYPPVIPEQK